MSFVLLLSILLCIYLGKFYLSFCLSYLILIPDQYHHCDNHFDCGNDLSFNASNTSIPPFLNQRHFFSFHCCHVYYERILFPANVLFQSHSKSTPIKTHCFYLSGQHYKIITHFVVNPQICYYF